VQTFETQLDPVTWTEVLHGGGFLAFDIVEARTAEVYLSNSPGAPTGAGHMVQPWPHGFDFEANGLIAGRQRIWVRGDCIIRGVRE